VGRPVEGALERNEWNLSSWITNLTVKLSIPGLYADANGPEYTLWAEKTGYETSTNEIANVTPHNTSNARLEIQGGVILGWVHDQIGNIANATVSISALGYSNKTDADGNYRLYGIPGGIHSVTVSAPGYANQTLDVTLVTGDFATQHFYMIPLTGRISGLVLHASTLEPLAGANLSVQMGSVTVTVTSDVNGTYLIPGLSAGTYTVSANLEGFNESTVAGVAVESGETTEEVDLHLEEKPTKLLGTVRSGTVLLVGANVSVWGTEYYGLSSIEGKYEIDGIPAGTYTVEASLHGYLNVTILGVEIAMGSELQLNFNLTGLPGALYGIVVDAATGNQLAGVTVVVLPQRETITNTNGEFQFTGLPADEYIVRFTLDGYQPKEIGPITTTLDETTEMGSIDLKPTRESFGGFIFGFDLAHSMMILALFLTIIILAFAVVLRIRTFEAPDKAPAIYDELDEEDAEEAQEEDELDEEDASEPSVVDEPGAGNKHSGE